MQGNRGDREYERGRFPRKNVERASLAGHSPEK